MPVSPNGDGAEPLNLLPMGTRELLVSARGNRERVQPDALAETMPGGSLDIRQQAGGLPPSDVTVRVQRITNSGRTVGAGSCPSWGKGWSPVPRLVGAVIESQQSGRVPQVGTGREARRGRCKAVAASFAALRVVPGAFSEHESGDGRMPVSTACRRARSVPCIPPLEGWVLGGADGP